MSSAPGKPVKIHPLIIILTVLSVFGLAIYGYHQELGDEFNVWGGIYSALGLFFFHDINPKVENLFVLVAEYLASIVFIIGVFSLVFSKIYKAFTVTKIKLLYRNHIVVFSLTHIGRKLTLELLKSGHKVIVIDRAESHYASEIQRKGGIVLQEDDVIHEFENSAIHHAYACVLAETNDVHNMKLVNSLISFLHDKRGGHVTKILVHVNQTDNINILKDYLDINNRHEHYDLETFNVNQLAARKIYDLFSPAMTGNEVDKDEEQSVVIVGYNQAAEDFILENVILSHSPALANLKIYLLNEHADTNLSHFAYKYPFYNEYIDLIPVKLLNSTFYANFTWSKKDIEKISKVKAAYMFGDSDSALLTASTNLRQFFYAQTLSISQVPIIVCLPEDADVISLLDADNASKDSIANVFNHQLNIKQVRLVSDTCTTEALIEESALTDKMARVINYYYSLKYDFAHELKTIFNYNNGEGVVTDLEKDLIMLPEKTDNTSEKTIEDTVLRTLASKTEISYNTLKSQFSIQKRWNILSHRKKDSNRYAARQIALKIYSLKRLGCWPLNRENITKFYPRLAPMEHKRWSAEKIIFNFKYGPLPENKAEKFVLKDILKIHDQLIPFEELNEIEKEKDLNLFLLLPLLNSIKSN